MIEVHYLTFNPFSENTYILFNENKDAAIVDAGNYYDDESEQLFSFIKTNQLNVKYLLQTHCHIDHIFGMESVCNSLNLTPTMHKNELIMLQYGPQSAARFGVSLNHYNRQVNFIVENSCIKLGNDELSVIEIPGHSPGHLGFYCKQQSFIISGDVLFYESIGRTDLPLCNYEDLIFSIKNKLFTLPNETVVYSGHGIKTSIGYEKENNPFVQ